MATDCFKYCISKMNDYHGKEMTIHDACHARGRNSSEMQESVRKLCSKMNISLIEPSLTKDETPCCGGCAKSIETRKRMAFNRCESLPLDDVVLYCTGCVRSFSVTKAVPHHLLERNTQYPNTRLLPCSARKH